MQRYFVEVNGNNVIFKEEDVHHITHVMRMRVGDRFDVVNIGHLYNVEITSLSPLKVKIVEEKQENSELDKYVVLFFALAKGDKMDLVIQKATELGAHQIILFKSKRCVVNFDQKDLAKKMERYQRIAKEASEQCHRIFIPTVIGNVELKQCVGHMGDVNFLAYEKEAGSTAHSFELPKEYKSVSVMIGPEGGFDEEEVDFLVKQGFQTVSLGRRILRCETAAIYALSVLAHKIEQ